ncbi:GNAT family N-acetyltransferase [Shewanella sp. SR43-8]|uniref:GNAT family N-acetyltransferase n=1 Tax=Shewanella sp. SR43-8 TaxID=2760938 RepID=UPI0016020299|nr:GNAT family N-acetyltransferase [Shewanella sp. SR43-8]MBB1323297.1 GNAT family N-acetyltransferase [Shewanella sp. SR43-8]
MKVITETPRLIIREFTIEDAPAVLHFNTPEQVNRYTGDAGVCTRLQDAENIIRDIWLVEYQQYGFGRWAVVLKDSNTVIGFCGFKNEIRINAIDIGYRLHPDYWGIGLATEANKACIEYANKHMNLDIVYADVADANSGSINVATKLGMTYHSQYQDGELTFNRYVMSFNNS